MRYFKTNRAAKIITIVIFLGILFAVAFGIYAFFHWEFGLIAGDTYLHLALPLYFYEGLLLVVFLLVFLSSFVSGMFALFRGARDAFVIASPRFKLVFWKVYRRTLLQALWPIFIIILPAFLGSNSVLPMGLLGAILFFISMFFLAAIGVSFAFALFMVEAMVLYVAARASGWSKLFSFGKSAFFGVVTIILGIVYVWHRIGIGDISALFAPFDASWSTSRLDIILGQFSVFPSSLAALVYLSAQLGSIGSAAIATIGLALMFGMSLVLLWLLSLAYLPLWQLFQEGNGGPKIAVKAGAKPGQPTKPAVFPKYFKSPLGAVFEKEGIILFREMKSALWFFFLFVLWMVQVILEFFIRENLLQHGERLGSIVPQIEALQVGTAIYFISAFILRFVFPAFSGEQKTAWIIGVSPLKTQSIFWAKLFFYGAIFLVLGVVFCGVNFAIIELPVAQALSLAIFLFLMIAFLVSFGLGLGAMFPNFETDDPEVLSTSLPGLGFIIFSLSYGGLGTYLFYRALALGQNLPIAGFDVVSALLVVALIALSLNSLDKFEFAKDSA